MTNVINDLKKLPAFNLNIVSKYFNSYSYAKLFVHRLRKNNTLFEIANGIYSFYNDPMIYATNIYYPSYLSFSSAFQYYGITTQLPFRIMVATFKNRSLNDIELIKISDLYGYKRDRYNGFDIFIAEPEKAVIDSIIKGNTPLDELNNAIKICDISKLERYAVRSGKKVSRITGYLLEMNEIESEILRDFLGNDRNIAYTYYEVKKNNWMVRQRFQ